MCRKVLQKVKKKITQCLTGGMTGQNQNGNEHWISKNNWKVTELCKVQAQSTFSDGISYDTSTATVTHERDSSSQLVWKINKSALNIKIKFGQDDENSANYQLWFFHNITALAHTAAHELVQIKLHTHTPCHTHIIGWIMHWVQRWQTAIRNSFPSLRWVFFPIQRQTDSNTHNSHVVWGEVFFTTRSLYRHLNFSIFVSDFIDYAKKRH